MISSSPLALLDNNVCDLAFPDILSVKLPTHSFSSEKSHTQSWRSGVLKFSNSIMYISLFSFVCGARSLTFRLMLPWQMTLTTMNDTFQKCMSWKRYKYIIQLPSSNMWRNKEEEVFIICVCHSVWFYTSTMLYSVYVLGCPNCVYQLPPVNR